MKKTLLALSLLASTSVFAYSETTCIGKIANKPARVTIASDKMTVLLPREGSFSGEIYELIKRGAMLKTYSIGADVVHEYAKAKKTVTLDLKTNAADKNASTANVIIQDLESDKVLNGKLSCITVSDY
jgi:hypothetical protein